MSAESFPPESPDLRPAERFARNVEHPAALETRIWVDSAAFRDAVGEIREAGARFITIFVAETPELALTAVFAWRGEIVLLQVAASADGTIAYQEIGNWWPAVAWPEREMIERDLRVDSGRGAPEHPLTKPDPDLVQRALSGLDTFTIPYGPVRSGVFEAIQFQIETGGEDVAQLQTRPFFKHRGIEARFGGMPPELGIHVAERVAGIASCAYATAFSQAVERALGVEPPRRAQRWRVVHCELERMACHLDVIAKEAETTALSVGQARFQILKERVQRLLARLTGSRFGRGAILPGGVRDEGGLTPDQLREELEDIERDLQRDRRLFLATSSMTDRLIGAGRLPRATVEEYCAVGPLARGSGISTDARHARPYGDYQRLGLQVIVQNGGDAMARINVRFGELLESLRLLRRALEWLRRSTGKESGGLRSPLPRRESGTACGWAEAPQGELLFWVELRDGLVHRAHVASPSLRNWALFDRAFPKDVLTDFAFIEHSFGLTPAGADR